MTRTPWRAQDYVYEKKGALGIACDEMETFIISPGVPPTDDDIKAICSLYNELLADYNKLLEHERKLDNEQGV